MLSSALSPIVLGTAPFGTGISQQTSFEILDAYVAHGGRVLDTAAVYGMGASEQTVGAWLGQRGMRDKIIISTKGGHPSLPDWHSRITRADVYADLEASLRYLQTDYVDIYFLHRDDESLPVESIMPMLDRLVREGKARYIGASNWRVERINEANAFARENGLAQFAISQIFWCGASINKAEVYDQTLVCMDGDEHAGYAKNHLPVMAYTAQARGLFSLMQSQGTDALPEDMKRTYLNAETLGRAERIRAISEKTGISPTVISLAYLLYDPHVKAYPIIGTSRPERIAETMQVFSLEKQDLDLLFS